MMFALTTRGLETLSRDEIARLAGAQVIEVGYRRIAFDFHGDLTPLTRLRTVDDVFLDLGVWRGIGRPRETLARVEALATQLELWNVLDRLEHLREIPAMPVFSATVSYVGKRNYTSDEVKTAVANGVSASHGWDYSPDVRDSHLNLRLFIEHDHAYIGVRLCENALHERAYKRAQRPGSLKPTVAAALLHMADVTPQDTLLDPFCGAGTILLEAQALGATVTGGDLDADALHATRTNAGDEPIALAQWDGRDLPLADHAVDVVVSNLPWGRQISVDDALADFYRSACAEMARVVRRRVVILTSLPHLLVFPTLHQTASQEISLFGQRPQMVVFSASVF